MKKFACRSTGKIVTGTFKEANKKLKEAGCDWIFVKDGDTRDELFTSIDEFISKYDEELNPLFSRVLRDLKSWEKNFNK